MKYKCLVSDSVSVIEFSSDIYIVLFCISFQLNDSSDDYEFSVQFTKNSRGLGFTISSYIGDLNSGN